MPNHEGEYGRIEGGLGDWTRRLRKEPPVEAEYRDPIDRVAKDSSSGFAALHARRYIATHGADDGWDGPRPILILYTRGRKSGDIRRNPLLFFEHEGERYIVGSKGGVPEHPDWFRNIAAFPHVLVRVQADFHEAGAEVQDNATRARLWPLLVARYPMFGEYQASTTREIPLVRLVRRGPYRGGVTLGPAGA